MPGQYIGLALIPEGIDDLFSLWTNGTVSREHEANIHTIHADLTVKGRPRWYSFIPQGYHRAYLNHLAKHCLNA